MVCTLIDHRNDAIKCSKHGSEIIGLRLVVPLEVGTFYGVISMVYKSADHEKVQMVDLLNSYLSF